MLFAAGSTLQIIGCAAAQPVAVPTYHYDNLRTGWNSQETTLTATNPPRNFGLIQVVNLDDQVDAQPLVVPVSVAGVEHDIVYVATESNTIYAIDAASGTILLQRNLGAPVVHPIGCNNNGPNVGINSTPVIDLATQTLYVIAYVNSSPPTYQLHALNLRTLADNAGSPVTVTASHTLTDGSTFTFDATYQRQRPALLEFAGNIYAGFGSFCDFEGNHSRGWVLGWNANTLSPLPGNLLTDMQATSPTNFFLSSIWMSGYGIAASGADLYFATGNSDCNVNLTPELCPSQSTYNGTTNIQESVVALNTGLARVDGVFTPPNVLTLDQGDADLGSGGVLLLPQQSGPLPSLALIGGKDGNLYLLDRTNMATPLDKRQLWQCWCGPSFFTGPDGIGRVVTSHGSTLGILQVSLSPTPHLVVEGTAQIASGQDPGFFTVVSSNGTQAGSAIIWAVGRPTNLNSPYVNLYAFAATASGGTYALLYSATAGYWPSPDANANIVPVVANGKVYVASYKVLAIFGVPPATAPKVAAQMALAPAPLTSLESQHLITGTLQAVDGSIMTLQTRTGKSVKIDGAQAVKDQRMGAPLTLGTPLTAQGSSIEGNGALLATSIVRAKGPSSQLWPPDR